MTDSGQSEPAAAAAAAPPQQPFRFTDLPMEIRFMVLEELMDNPKDTIRFTAPKNLDVEEVRLDGMYYPSLLKVNKSTRDEYWSLCLRESILWIVYACTDSAHPDTENSEEEKPTMPPISDWVMIPTRILERVTEVVFKFQADWMLPEINPFSGIADCIDDISGLQLIGIWSEMDMAVVERVGDQAERQERFQNFVENLFLEEGALYNRSDDDGHDIFCRTDCNLWVPLFEMNKNYCWPRRRHLQQGVAPLAGLPEWGYSMFKVHAPWNRPLENSFTYHGEELEFLRVEYELPVLDRSETECDSPSEWDYEFDESGFATGNMPDWSTGARPLWMDHE